MVNHNRKLISKLIFLILVIGFSSFSYADEVRRTWPFTGIGGAGTGTLDGAIAGVSINQHDQALGTYVINGVTHFAFYRVDNSGASGTTIVSPADVGAGTTRWNLIMASNQDTGTTASPKFEAVTIDNIALGGTSKYMVHSGITVTPNMLRGGLVYWHSSTMGGVTLPLVSGNTAFVVIKDVYGSGLTVFTENSQDLLNQVTPWGTRIWVPPNNLGHQVAITSVKSGASNFWDVIGVIGSNWRVAN